MFYEQFQVGDIVEVLDPSTVKCDDTTCFVGIMNEYIGKRLTVCAIDEYVGHGGIHSGLYLLEEDPDRFFWPGCCLKRVITCKFINKHKTI